MSATMIHTDAWVLHHGRTHANGLAREPFAFAPPADHEVLVEPLYGCWEGNMAHALTRAPVDICEQRGEDRVVIGNAGVVRVLRVGSHVSLVKPGDACLVFCNADADGRGYPRKIYAYDAPGTIGLLARQTKLHERQLIPVPPDTRYSLRQWAAFSLRYITAWANWKVAHACWCALPRSSMGAANVWGWGGGVAFAEIDLAARHGFRSALIASHPARLAAIADLGVQAIDRRPFSALHYDQDRCRSDACYRDAYMDAEQRFLQLVSEQTEQEGVSIFIDFIGLPVFRVTLKALARPGVVTSAGWKAGMALSTVRALECMNWHVHVHTHYACREEALDAVAFADAHGWLPTLDDDVYDWDDIPRLAGDYANDSLSSYFPLFRINAE